MSPGASFDRVEDKYGTIAQHLGECRTCGRIVEDNGSIDGFKRIDRELGQHIDDGSACHDYRIDAVYEDGGERRVI